MTHAPATAARPLVLSTDEDLLDEILRLLATAGTEAELAAGGSPMRRAYREAPLVLVGADVLVGSCAPLGTAPLPRRPGVIAVTTEELSATGWARAVELGVERVVRLPDDESWLLARAATAVRTPTEPGWLLAVGGSCGGAGVSTLAAAVALVAAPGVVLIDADPWGAGLDLLLGAERADGLRWPELTGLRGRVAGDALLAALPEVDGVHVLAAGRADPVAVPEGALTAVVEAIRAEGVPVVVDLPRGAGVEHLGQAVLAEADLVVLVVPARLRAATAARLLVAAPGSAWAAAHLVVRLVPGGLSGEEVGRLVGRPVLAELGHDRSAGSRGERGAPPVVSARSRLGGAARRVLEALPPGTGPW